MKKTKLILLTALFSAVMATTAFASGWKQSADGRWWYGINADDSLWYGDGWCTLYDGSVYKAYYFDEQGYMLVNTVTPDGHQVNEKGEYVVNGIAQVAPNNYTLPSGLENVKTAITVDHVVDPARRTTTDGWFQEADGSWRYGFEGEWVVGMKWIADGAGKMECYWFLGDGIMQSNMSTPGRSFNGDGKWEKDGQVVAVNAPSPAKVLDDNEMISLLKERDPETYNRIFIDHSGSSSSSDSGSSSSDADRSSSDSDELVWEGEWTDEHMREYMLERQIYDRIGLEYTIHDYIRKHSN